MDQELQKILQEIKDELNLFTKEIKQALLNLQKTLKKTLK